jgi:hypothetical protein
MRFLLIVIGIALLSWGVTWIMPWWSVVLVAAVFCAAARIRPGRAFRAGFLGVFLFWGTADLVVSSANDHLLAGRMGLLFHLPHWSLFILVSAVVGGLVGGLGGWSGAAIQRAFVGTRRGV